jgi:glycosyltransferase involved in cell wall biosynthesis
VSEKAERGARRKLCIVIPSHWDAIMGGSQYQAKVLLEYLLPRYAVDVFYLTTRSHPSTRPQGYSIVQFSNREGLRRRGFFLDTLRLYRALRRIRPDAIIQFVGCAHTGIAAFYALRHRCKMVWRVSSDRSVEPERSRWWALGRRIERCFLEFGIRHAPLIAAQTEYQRQQLAQNFQRRGVVVLRNFHPLPRPVERERASHWVESGDLLIVWVANLKPLKNPAAFVRLARALSDQPRMRFVMLGRAMGDDSWTRALLADIAATANIRYLGERPQHDVNALLAHASLLVNTSDYEGFSNTFIQAWMRGVPVVSLHVDPDALLSQARLGVVTHDEEGLRSAVVELLSSDTIRHDISRRCRAYATARHGEANIDELAQALGLPKCGAATSLRAHRAAES